METLSRFKKVVPETFTLLDTFKLLRIEVLPKTVTFELKDALPETFRTSFRKTGLEKDALLDTFSKLRKVVPDTFKLPFI